MYKNREDVKTFRIAPSLSVRQMKKLMIAAEKAGKAPTTLFAELAFQHPLLRDDPTGQEGAKQAAA